MHYCSVALNIYSIFCINLICFAQENYIWSYQSWLDESYIFVLTLIDGIYVKAFPTNSFLNHIMMNLWLITNWSWHDSYAWHHLWNFWYFWRWSIWAVHHMRFIKNDDLSNLPQFHDILQPTILVLHQMSKMMVICRVLSFNLWSRRHHCLDTTK